MSYIYIAHSLVALSFVFVQVGLNLPSSSCSCLAQTLATINTSNPWSRIHELKCSSWPETDHLCIVSWSHMTLRLRHEPLVTFVISIGLVAIIHRLKNQQLFHRHRSNVQRSNPIFFEGIALCMSIDIQRLSTSESKLARSKVPVVGAFQCPDMTTASTEPPYYVSFVVTRLEQHRKSSHSQAESLRSAAVVAYTFTEKMLHNKSKVVNRPRLLSSGSATRARASKEW
jgi:hypothetical protein